MGASDLSGGHAGQDEISKFCGVGRTHVPRVLKPLLADSLMEEDLGRIRGISRRVKVYSLTPAGIETAGKIRESLLIRDQRWKDDDGRVKEGPLSEVLSIINSRLAGSGMRSIPLSLLLTLDDDPIAWNDVLWLSNSIGMEEGSSICLPGGWFPVKAPESIEGPTGMEDIMGELDRIIEKRGISLVIGPEGMGKRTAVSTWAERRGKKALWLSHGSDEGEICLDEGGFDLLVILDPDMIDIGPSVLDGGNPALTDPRVGKWPEVFTNMPLIGIQDGDLDMDVHGVVKASGVSREHFVSVLKDMGFPEALSIEIHSAVKGSPGSLDHIGSLSKEERDKIISSDRETAVMMVLLGSSK